MAVKKVDIKELKDLDKFDRVKLEGEMNEYQRRQYNKLVIHVEGRGGKVLIGIYQGSSSYFVLECEKGCRWVVMHRSITSDKSWCPTCSGRAPYTLKQLKEFAKTMIEDDGSCGDCFSMESILRTDGKKKDTGSTRIFAEWKCGYKHEWKARVDHVINDQTWCPYCGESKLERVIRNWLKANNIRFIRQWTYITLRSPRGYALRADFYLIDYDCLLEGDGMQHIMIVDVFGGEEGFKGRLVHDAIKNMWSRLTRSALVRIPYRCLSKKGVDAFMIDVMKRLADEESVIIDEFEGERMDLLKKYGIKAEVKW